MNFTEFWIFRYIDVVKVFFYIELQFCERIKVMQTINPVKSKIEITYWKSFFMRKSKLINVILPSRIGEIK